MYAILQHMVQNSLRSGRPLGFDPNHAVVAAMEIFWEKGYDRVGVAELEKCTGLNRSSLYNTFGGKDGMFCLALQHYSKEVADRMLGGLIHGKDGLEDVQRFVDDVAQHLSAQDGRGCFMANTMANGPDANDVVAKQAQYYIEHFLGAMRTVLQRAANLGELPANQVETVANMLLGVMLGVNLLARARQAPHRIRKVLNAMMACIRLIGTGQDC